jgi:hypothetical protein
MTRIIATDFNQSVLSIVRDVGVGLVAVDMSGKTIIGQNFALTETYAGFSRIVFYVFRELEVCIDR